jgi:serine/threonine protein kinase
MRREKREFKGQEKYGDWLLLARISSGGNGEVWACENGIEEEKRAIKLLKKTNEIAYERFKDEIKVISENQDIEGVISILDYYLPVDFQNEVPFYVMPKGISLQLFLAQDTFEKSIDCVISIAECLKELHHREIAHRDIKPSNIIALDGSPHLIDFGLVDFPDKSDLTGKKEKIGPRWTIAPEILRLNHDEVDFLKADVYSLSKTLWILLMGIEEAFEGQYSIESIIELKNKYPNTYTTPIDNLLSSGTDNDSEKRPSIDVFLNQLIRWKALHKDFHVTNNEQWNEILSKLFPVSPPIHAVWEEIDDIIRVLKMLSSIPNLNHMFHPLSGGYDLEDARLSNESGCIELDFQIIYIVKPKRLIFESFGVDAQWNYFRLETGNLAPSDFYDNEERHGDESSEEVSELSPGKYEHCDFIRNSYYLEDDYTLPKFARHVVRQFEGDFVIFNKRSYYNLYVSDYDGKHNTMTTNEFREYIENSIHQVQ